MSRLGSLADSARRTVAGVGTTPAVVDGVTRWSWAELDERADAVAAGLLGAGVAVGDRVALLAHASAPAVAAMHGIARVGGVVAPLGLGLTVPELTAAAEVIDPRLIVYGPTQRAAATALGRRTLALDELTAPGPRPELDAMPTIDRAEPAAIVLTSGTTGSPKAVILSTAALIASGEAWLTALPPATGWLLALGLQHVAGLGVVWRAALSGVPLVVLPRSKPTDIVAGLENDPWPSHVSLVPTTLARLLDAVADRPPPATLRAVLLGGGAIPPDLVSRAIGAGWPVVPTYGLSEGGSGVTALPTGEAARHPGSAGRPLPGVEVRIAEPDDAGVGEIIVATPARFTGYLDDPVGTSVALTDGGWLRTGDLGRLDVDGRLTVLDRRTDLIVRGGENISPVEVEAVLREHPAIADAAVVGRRDAVWGHVPVAAIVLRADVADPGDDDLIRHGRRHLATFKVPVAFVRLGSLPMTASGKLRRDELRASLEAVPLAVPRHRRTERPGGVRIAYRSLGSGPVHLVVLPGTMSTAGQLTSLVRLLADPGDLTVHGVDRRGSGDSRLTEPAPLGIEAHVDDLAAVLDAEGCRATALFGVSFGGVLALEFAARMPERSLAVVAYEPPYGPVGDAGTRRAFAAVAAATERAFGTGGAPAAAEAFLRGVGGASAWERLSEGTRDFLAGEGVSAFVDAGLRGLDPSGLGRIDVPVTILTGEASDPLYRPIADALAGRIPRGRRVHLPAMTHAAPITAPTSVAEAVRTALTQAGILRPIPDHRSRPESQA